VTGHGEAGADEPDWVALARPRTTAVFYMGLARLEHIAARLIENGAPLERPAALIAQGTTAQQQVVVATIGTIRAQGEAQGIESPALLVVGDVASLHSALAWFDASPVADSDSQSA
jgi:siroheme synthase